MKFVVLRVTHGTITRDMPFIFPGEVVHKNFADLASAHLRTVHGANAVKVVSAGSCCIDAIECFGNSETLKVDARGAKDEILIQTMPYLHGIGYD